MTRRKRSDSLDAALERERAIPTEVPRGVALSETEKEVWDQMILVRQEWREFDLLLMAKVVRLEVKIRDWWGMLDKSGPMIRNKRDTLIENPILRSIDTLQRQQLAIITKMHLMSHADPRTLNRENQAADLSEIKNGNVISLLAR